MALDASLVTFGAQAPDLALTLNRAALGAFFAISGYHKLFTPARHTTLARTLQEDGVPAVPVMQWLVPAVEFGAGCALVAGFLSALAACGLFVVCLAAVVLDARKRIASWEPLDRADWVGDVLYLPETLYCVGLAVVMLAGPGRFSVDAQLARMLAT